MGHGDSTYEEIGPGNESAPDAPVSMNKNITETKDQTAGKTKLDDYPAEVTPPAGDDNNNRALLRSDGLDLSKNESDFQPKLVVNDMKNLVGEREKNKKTLLRSRTPLKFERSLRKTILEEKIQKKNKKGKVKGGMKKVEKSFMGSNRIVWIGILMASSMVTATCGMIVLVCCVHLMGATFIPVLQN